MVCKRLEEKGVAEEAEDAQRSTTERLCRGTGGCGEVESEKVQQP